MNGVSESEIEPILSINKNIILLSILLEVCFISLTLGRAPYCNLNTANFSSSNASSKAVRNKTVVLPDPALPLNKINSHEGNVRASSHLSKLSGYTGTMTLSTYTKSGTAESDGWSFMNIFPTSLDQIDVNWDPNDAVMEYTINWAYDYWELTE